MLYLSRLLDWLSGASREHETPLGLGDVALIRLRQRQMAATLLADALHADQRGYRLLSDAARSALTAYCATFEPIGGVELDLMGWPPPTAAPTDGPEPSYTWRTIGRPPVSGRLSHELDSPSGRNRAKATGVADTPAAGGEE